MRSTRSRDGWREGPPNARAPEALRPTAFTILSKPNAVRRGTRPGQPPPQHSRARGLTAYGFHDPVQAQRRKAWDAATTTAAPTLARPRPHGLRLSRSRPSPTPSGVGRGHNNRRPNTRAPEASRPTAFTILSKPNAVRRGTRPQQPPPSVNAPTCPARGAASTAAARHRRREILRTARHRRRHESGRDR